MLKKKDVYFENICVGCAVKHRVNLSFFTKFDPVYQLVKKQEELQ